ncbi:glycosyl hydrolase [Hymenobacter cavernae]|uniref:Glycoside hydrolase n=1 Tax=Hymenobacter cavernae TaxID=2044852 RepID=A0ABQ1UW81_9BACT|nr:glycosyl hydrolase [Hymenobacter cavernae]GGF26787.1 hypothetical protein GCM10011383_42920 [Hymenobacter cavernae]
MLSWAQQRPWQQLQQPTVVAVAAQFKTPPPEFGATVTWGWNGAITPQSISRDLDSLHARGVQAVTIEAGYDMGAAYLSTGWFELVKEAVNQAKRRNMRVWIIDEGKYPSGFAGGKFSAEKPELRMQGLATKTIKLAAGETFSQPMSARILGALAINTDDKSSQVLPIKGRKLTWKAPAGNWQVLLVLHKFRTSVTRAANNATHGKDTLNSLCDYLNPAATRQFLEFTHVQYQKYIGDEFGQTVLGFRGDEPDYGFIPWTPALPAEFRRRKGYDITPYIASFFAPQPTYEQRRAKADFWDVWSDLFRDNFFKVQADWCAAHHLEYFVHLNHEEKMMELVRSEGDFFKDMRYVQIPGVDAIWSQIWPDKVADFPKLASSAAHLFGRPRSFSESFAAYSPAPTVAQAQWVIDHQLVRGINLFELMYAGGSAATGKMGLSKYLAAPEFPALAAYLNRACYLLAQGSPATQIALYHPTPSLWLGDEEANQSTLAIAQQLLEHQRDFDFVDDYSLATGLTAGKGELKNVSGQSYRTVLIPSVSVLSKEVLARLRAFAQGGGQVIFLGKEPTLVAGSNYLKASSATALTWAVREPSGQLTPAVLAALPRADVTLDQPTPAVKYLHRRWQNADLYFFFNEGEQPVTRQLTVSGLGQAQLWDAANGTITNMAEARSGQEALTLPLQLAPHQTRFIVLTRP